MLQYSIDDLFHALAAPGRRAMVDRLARGSATLSELAEPMDMTLTAVTQHLRILEASGLVHSYKQGRTRHCRLRVWGHGPSNDMDRGRARHCWRAVWTVSVSCLKKMRP